MSELIEELEKLTINKGTGAGGKETNVNGKAFEKYTDIESYLISKGFRAVRILNASFITILENKYIYNAGTINSI